MSTNNTRGRVERLESRTKAAAKTAADALAVAGGGSQPAYNVISSSSGAIGINDLVWSDNPNSVAKAPIASPPLAVFGPALEGVGPGSPVKVAKPGQIVTMLSDGTGVLANGDHVRVSTTVAGRVELVANVPGNHSLGIVFVGAGANPGAPVKVWFMPGII